MYRTTIANIALILAFLIGVIVVDRLTGWMLGELLSRTWTGEAAGQANYALAQTDREVIFFGSSRARQHFDPRVVRERTGLSGFNAGANGQNTYYVRVLSRLMLTRGSQAAVWVVNVDPGDIFGPNPERLAFLRPFAGEDHLVVDLLAEWDRWAPMKAWSHAWRYNTAALSIVWNYVTAPSPAADGFVSRAVGVRGTFDVRQVGAGIVPRDGSGRGKSLIAEIVAEGKRAGIEVILVSSPVYAGLVASEDRAAWLRQRELAARVVLDSWANDLGVRYEPFHADRYPVFSDAGLFADPAHLNAAGAEVISNLVADVILAELEATDAQAVPGSR